MMNANEDGKNLERDTAMCGDPKMWYPMRVTYGREMKVKAELVVQGSGLTVHGEGSNDGPRLVKG